LRRVAISLSLLVVVLALNSCAVKKDHVYPETDALLLMERLDHYNRLVDDVDAQALVVFKNSNRNYSFRASLIAVGNGEKLRLTISDFVFKKPLVSIVKNGDDLTVILYTKKQYVQEPYDNLEVEEISGLNMRKEILLAALLGKVFTDEQNSVITNPYPLVLVIERNDGLKETVSFDSELLPAEVTYQWGYEVYTMVFHEYMTVSGVVYPKRVSVTHGDRLLEINYSDVRINQPLAAYVFHVDEKMLEGFERRYMH
jgi:hypothetical protein